VRTVFADAFYFIALLNERDQAHLRVRKLALIKQPLLTTDWILTEVADACAKLPDRNRIVDFIHRLQTSPNVRIAAFSSEYLSVGCSSIVHATTRNGL
jgi:hypothetical protein